MRKLSKKTTQVRPRVLVTGGPTRAYLDRVRYLSNHSSGRTAYELCKTLTNRGADVCFVCGPVSLPLEELGVRRLIKVETPKEMMESVLSQCKMFRPGFAVFAAAVLDFVPERVRSTKVSSKGGWTIHLKPTAKIVDAVRYKHADIRRVGFKLEWNRQGRSPEKLAHQLIKEKGYEAICVNFLSEIHKKQHPALLMSRSEEGTHARYKARTKKQIANWIANYILRSY